MDAVSLFSPDYVTARRRIVEAASRLGCQTEAYSIGASGPQGEDLTIDVVVTPGTSLDPTLVLSSGIHGVEGFVGSAVQLDVLEDSIARKSRPAVRCVLLHALNPYGFAWRRRANETNIDLNRNLLRAGEAFTGSPAGYARLDRLLNPRRGPSRSEPVTLKFLLAIARFGMPALKGAVASGQYDYPRGLFYGGDRPSPLNDLLSTHFDSWLGDSRRIMHLDIHTGLGDRATCTLLVDYPLSDAQHRRLSAWFGAGSFEALHAHGVAYPVRGSFGQWCMARIQGRDYLHAGVEFGTDKPTTVLAGLRAENQAHHWCQAGDPVIERTRQHLVELFCPRSEEWRVRVLEHSRRLIAQAISGLTEGNV